MDDPQYQIGHGLNAYGMPVWVGYQPAIPGKDVAELIYVQLHTGRDSHGACKPPAGILEFKNPTALWIDDQGKRKFGGMQEEPNWFEHRCREAKCEWFVPMVKRMAAGEFVSLEEIQAAYSHHNSGPMPCGEWRLIFQ